TAAAVCLQLQAGGSSGAARSPQAIGPVYTGIFGIGFLSGESVPAPPASRGPYLTNAGLVLTPEAMSSCFQVLPDPEAPGSSAATSASWTSIRSGCSSMAFRALIR